VKKGSAIRQANGRRAAAIKPKKISCARRCIASISARTDAGLVLKVRIAEFKMRVASCYLLATPLAAERYPALFTC